jgi:V8-like Glu-specific endopeptidase
MVSVGCEGVSRESVDELGAESIEGSAQDLDVVAASQQLASDEAASAEVLQAMEGVVEPASFPAQLEKAKQAVLQAGWKHRGKFEDFLPEEKQATTDGAALGEVGLLFVSADHETFTKYITVPKSEDGEHWGIPGDPGTVDPSGILEGPAESPQAGLAHSFATSSVGPGSTSPQIIGAEHLEPFTSQWLMGFIPYRQIGKISSRLNGWARDGQGTGTLIGPRHVATAGHVVYVEDLEQWIHYSNWTSRFFPGQFNDGTQPWGAGRVIVGAWSTTNYVVHGNLDYDVGWLLLEDRPETAQLGWFGMCTAPWNWLDDQEMVMLGYPASKPYSFSEESFCKYSPLGQYEQCGGYMYEDIYACQNNYANGVRVRYDCDTLGGMSGAALWEWEGGGPCLYGTHWGYQPSANRNQAFRFLSTWIAWTRDTVICPHNSIYNPYSWC